MRTVANILQNKPPVFNFIDPDAKVIEALQLMNSVNLSYLVVKHNNDFHGIFSERDYSRKVVLKGLHSSTCTVKDVMNTSLPMVTMQDTAEMCMQLFSTHKTRYLLAFDQNVFKGVITIYDILREAIENKEMVFDKLALQAFSDMQDKIY
ncbi:MAG: CBS domain-containing protein [Ferruginibacter sp.]|nr:CBS domain-containing protein [Ferruginibacter sp.]